MLGVRAVLDQRTKFQLAVDRLFGTESREAVATPADVPAFRSLGHAFRIITG